MTPPSNKSDPSFDTRRVVVSESKFPNKSSLDAIRDYLRTMRATGKLVINFAQGGTNSVVFEERQSVDSATEIHVV